MAVWDADLPTGVERAKWLIAQHFPALVALPVEPFGEGFDNAAFRVGPYVFRFPRRRFAVPLLEREIRHLPALAAALPLPISAPVWAAKDEAGHPFAGYRRIEGRTADRARLGAAERSALAPALGRFLRALHAQPADDLPPDELRRADPSHRLAFAREKISQLNPMDTALAARAEAVVEATHAAWQGPAERLCSVHGDLYPRHLIVEGGRLAGVIDWGDLHRGDPALDLGLAAAFLPPSAQPAFAEAYGGIDAATWARARFRAAWHTCATLHYGLVIGDADLLHEGRIALTHLGG